MTTLRAADDPDDSGENRWPTYLAVLLLETAVIAGLWAFGQYFSS